jgi:short-subunit dehydrogenase
LKFAADGAKVVLAARRKRLLKEIAEECRQIGAQALVVETDVSNSSEVEELGQRAVEQFGKIDVWVNNAGVGAVARFEETPLEEHEKVIQTNLMGTIYGSYVALQQFRKQGRGVLINVGSFAGKIAAPYLSSYSASKFGIRGLGMALRQEIEENGDRGIHVCTVMPVSMDTPFFEHAANHTGKPVQPIPPVYDPQKVVNVIYEVALRPVDEVVVGASGKLGSLGERFARKLTEKQMARTTHKAQMGQKKAAPDNSGSVFKPMSSGTDVYGGWMKKAGGGKVSTILGLAVPIGMGAAYLAYQRARSKREWQKAA